ncbi:RNA export factor gle2 [Cryomyces antarcticus]|uniref:RNA export factor gle2 n=1 Tax=Cryomyces antarcticus TaxID=329879 RepID=A0ABR0M6B8_9PEZI|nr:RNA export factor gle2 [Cryomyces antarcticus]KAK5013125.1 RNA export factor gle2 [Cryomyces antarcticus]KAK5159100.1 RNA export factor gle2 [Oleoguttula sp. CCFEE 6159]KAK5285382.1 RNA export factor gle2 [Cryomyces antarcticus]
MSTLFGSGASSTANSTQGDISKDVQVKDPPEDSISDLAFSPVSDHLAVASWDKKVRIYEIDQQGNSQGKALFDHEGPVLSCCWSKDGTKVVGGGADKAARMLDLGAGGTTAQQVAVHDQPIRCVEMIQVQGTHMLVTGSWDKTVKYWDLRQAQPAATLQLQERVYDMSVRDQLLVIGTADRYINMINLNEPTKMYKTMQSPLKYQTRVVSCFTDATGFAVGSIEGRCAIQYVEEKDTRSVYNPDYNTNQRKPMFGGVSGHATGTNIATDSSNFSFKCHRVPVPGQRDVANVYSVNAISFHPQHGTFSTAGSDGTFHFWDKDAKHRLKGYPEVGGSISATEFNRTGNIFAYAVSYDWSKGYAHNSPQLPNKIMLHPVVGDECKPRPGGKKR